jgi:hypothetical protein
VDVADPRTARPSLMRWTNIHAPARAAGGSVGGGAEAIQPKECHTRVSGHHDPGANIITRCAGTKSHTYDESWHRIECHIFAI